MAFRVLDVVVVTLVAVGTLTSTAGTASLVGLPLRDVLPLLVGGWGLLAALRSIGAYDLRQRETLVRHLLLTSIASAAGLALLAVATLLLDAGWAAMVAGLTATLVLLAMHGVWWLLVRRWRATGYLTPTVVIVGATAQAEELIAQALEHRDVYVLGVFDDRVSRSPDRVLGVPVLGTTGDLLTHRIVPYLDLVVVAIESTAVERVRELRTILGVLPTPVSLVFEQPDPASAPTSIARLVDPPLAPLGRTDKERAAVAKRIQDLVLGIPLLLVLLPVLGVIAIAVRLDSPGPALFRQRRYGFNNEQMVVRKFRTLRQESTDQRAEHQVVAEDDRVTRVGRVLRRTSLDELPQLVNVLTGEMSLVGPRPHAVGMKTGQVETAALVADYAHRHRVKPGMTGWAAIHGSRGPLETREEVVRRVELDLEYVDRQSFWLDTLIMLRTLLVLLGDRAVVR